MHKLKVNFFYEVLKFFKINKKKFDFIGGGLKMGYWRLIQNEEEKNAIAVCSFKHDNPHTISFKIGDKLELKEESDGN